MRMSKDIYKTVKGELIAVSCNEIPPELSTLWNGFDYNIQKWIYEGKVDTRTIEELQVSMKVK